MTADTGYDRHRGEVLAGVLTDPDAALCALASDGVLVPMPPLVGVPAERLMPVPETRSTLLDVVLPADSLTVVGAFERARAQSFASVHVRLRTDPDRRLLLTFVDDRARTGVLLGALQASTADDESPRELPVADLELSRRPRTATVRKNSLAVLTEIDERTTRMFGWSAADMVGKRSTEFLHPDDHERAIAAWLDMLAQQDGQRTRVRHSCADGTWVWVELENQYLPAEDPADAVVLTSVTDISDEMAALAALEQRERLLRRVAESLPLGILQLAADGSVVFGNSRLAALLGLPEVDGSGVDGVAAAVGAVADDDRPRLTAALRAALEGAADSELEVQVAAGQRICAVSLVSLGDREGAPGALLSFTDVSDTVRAREELTRRATVDPLTGCHNRAWTLALLDRALADDAAEGVAVLFLDLDGFKPVNDTLGHDAGDELLALTASRLTSLVRADDVVGRLGGDEFLLVCRGLAAPEVALATGRRVHDALAAPAVLAAGPVEISASIGIAWAAPGIPGAELVTRADRAMYRSKQDGRGRPVLYDPALYDPALYDPALYDPALYDPALNDPAAGTLEGPSADDVAATV